MKYTRRCDKIIYYTGKPIYKNHINQIVLVGGCFDLLHYGHIQFLYKAKEQGNYLIVALESDETIINYKKRSPIHNQLQRAKILSSLHFVNQVVMLPVMKGFADYNKLVQDVQPQVIAITKGDPQLHNKTIQAKLIGATVIEVSDLLTNNKAIIYSTSNIINNKLQKNDIVTNNKVIRDY